MNADINQTIERIIALYNSGGNPNQIMQTMISKHPNINQMGTQLQNMANGRNMSEFLLQLAKQNGVSEQNIRGLAQILGAK